jgi:hypothetical protein
MWIDATGYRDRPMGTPPQAGIGPYDMGAAVSATPRIQWNRFMDCPKKVGDLARSLASGSQTAHREPI